MKHTIVLNNVSKQIKDVEILKDINVKLIRKIILEEKERGTLICLASHNEEDIGILCDETYKIETGKILKHQYSGEQNEI